MVSKLKRILTTLATFLVLASFFFGSSYQNENDESDESVVSLTIKEYSNESLPYYLEEHILIDPTSRITGISICLWIYPVEIIAGSIFSITQPDGREILSLKILNENIIASRTNIEEYLDPLMVAFREWLHICVMYNNTLIAIGTSPGIDNKLRATINSNIVAFNIGQEDSLNVIIGADTCEEEPSIMIGIFADVRLFLYILNEEEITKIANFEEFTKPYVSLLKENNTKDYSLETVSKSFILESGSKYFIWLFKYASFPCNDAQNLCEKFNGRIPNETIDSEILKEFNKRSISKSFWISNSDNNCLKAFLSNNVTKAIHTKSTALKAACVISKQQIFYLKEDDSLKTFYANPFKELDFDNPAESLRIHYDMNSMTFVVRCGLWGFPSKESIYLDIKNVLGRYNWTFIDENNVTKRLVFSTCKEGEFTCSDGKCINMDMVCNFKDDCKDHSDEENCEPGLAPSGYYSKETLSKYNTSISLFLNLTRISSIDMDNNSIILCLFLRVGWKDNRLKFKQLVVDKSMVIDKVISAQFWSPTIALDSSTEQDEPFNLNSNPGTVYVTLKNVTNKKLANMNGYEVYLSDGEEVNIYHEKVSSVTIQCQIALMNFPFDDQECLIPFRLKSRESFRVKWDKNNINSSYFENALPFLYQQLIFYAEPLTEDSFEVIFKLKFSRKFKAYLFNTFLPCVILNIIGLLTFFLPYDDYNDRVATTLSCLIVMASLFAQISDSSPDSSEPTLLDIWMFCHCVVLFFVFIFNAIVIYMENKSKSGEETQNERILNRRKGLLSRIKKVNSTVDDIGYLGKITYMYDGEEHDKKLHRNYKIVNTVGLVFCSVIYIIFLAVSLYASLARKNL